MVMAHTATTAPAAPVQVRVGTLSARFWEVANKRGKTVALRWKNLGIWNDIPWSDYADAVRATGCALLAAGCRRGDRVAILSATRPEWCFVEFGAQGVGVHSVGIHATDSAAQLAWMVNECAVRILFVQDQEQLEKALSVLDQMPGIEKMVYFDASGLHAFAHPKVLAFDAFRNSGRVFHDANPARWETEVQLARPDDVATIAYTPGTTGQPKGVMLSHRNLLFQVEAMQRLCPSPEGDDQLSFLSMSHIVERCFSVYRPLEHGAVVHMGKGLPTLIDNLREIAPHVMMAVPRVWEKLHASVTIAIADSTPLARWAYGRALQLGYRVVALRQAGQPLPMGLKTAYFFARIFVLNRVLSLIGLRRARMLASGAAPISPDIVRWFMALNLPMVETYGQTECTGNASSHAAGRARPGTVGEAIAGTRIKLAADGEILVQGPHVFLGYLNQPARTSQMVVNGWLRTGDIGRLDEDGQLTITDRLNGVVVTSSGKRVAPSAIEAQLKSSPYIADAIVIGHGRPYLSCLVIIDHENVAKRAREMKLAFTNFSSLARAAEVRGLVQLEIDRVNGDFAKAENIRRFELIDAEIGLLAPELTATLQLRRGLVTEKYRAMVEALYADANA